MLAGLDEINWASLKDCYGPADGVPDLIRGLLTRDAKKQAIILDELSNQICHQASSSAATPYTIPFLIELCQHERIRNRDRILSLLLGIAIGLDSDMLYDQTNITEDMAQTAKESSTYPPAAVGVECYQGVAATVPVLLNLIEDPDRKTRINSAYNLAWFPHKQRRSLPRLRAAIRSTRNNIELSSLILSVGLLENQSRVARPIRGFVRPLLRHKNAMVRIASAIYMRWHDPKPESIVILREFVEDESFDGIIPFNNYCLSCYASRIVETA